MRNLSVAKGIAGAIAVGFVLLVISVLIVMLLFVVIDHFGGIGELSSEATIDPVKYVLMKVIVFVVVALIYLVLFINIYSRRFILARKWCIILLSAYAIGICSAVFDPNEAIHHEYNWIRYSTASVLVLAGLLAIGHSFSSRFWILDRLFGFAFGSLVILAAADEVYQFHERTSELAEYFSLSVGQDVPTLAIAISGAIALVGLLIIRSSMSRFGEFLRQKRYVYAANLFALAVVAFVIAMALDTFDYFVKDQTVNFLSLFIDGLHSDPEPVLLQVFSITTLSNTIEEILEYMTAVVLLMMVGMLFSIEALGFATTDKRQGSKGKFSN